MDSVLPRPLPPEVAKGMIVFPAKSFPLTKPLTGHAAMPHQMGYPMNTTSYCAQISGTVTVNGTLRRLSSLCSRLTRLASSL